MFSGTSRRAVFEEEVRLEITYLRKLHGDDAARVAAEKAVRPTNRTGRRKVLEEVARRLSGADQPARNGPFRRLAEVVFGRSTPAR